MTIYDAAMIGVVVAGMIWGAVRGITWQVASLASLVLGYVVAFPLSAQLAPHFPGEPVVARALALLATYAAVSGGVFLVAWMIRETLRRLRFEAFDRHLGMILGGLEGALVGVVATVFVVSLAPQTRDPILTSRAGRVVAAVLNATQAILPAEIRTHLTPIWEGGNVAEAAPAVREPAIVPAAITPDQPTPGAVADGGGLRGLIDRETRQAGRVVADELEKRIEQTGGTNERDVERR